MSLKLLIELVNSVEDIIIILMNGPTFFDVVVVIHDSTIDFVVEGQVKVAGAMKERKNKPSRPKLARRQLVHSL